MFDDGSGLVNGAPMKALVTGGGGFLGKALVAQLLARGDRVRSFARGDYPGLRELGVETRQGDLTDQQAVASAVRDCDIVFHVAAKAGVWGPYAEFHSINVIGTENVLNACRTMGVTRLVYTSSPSVVFGGHNLPGVDESAPYATDYDAPYPKTKAMAEKMVLESNDQNLATVALRPHLIWGPGDPNFAPRLIERGRTGRLAKVAGGPHLVDCIYLDNAAEAHLLAADRLDIGSPIAGRAYFISQGQPIDVGELMDRILGAAGLPPIKRTLPPWLVYAAGWALETVYRTFNLKGEPAMTCFVAKQLSTSHWFNMNAARKDLDYSPRISIDEGMQRLAEALAESSLR